jgi:hypothetical protein
VRGLVGFEAVGVDEAAVGGGHDLVRAVAPDSDLLGGGAVEGGDGPLGPELLDGSDREDGVSGLSSSLPKWDASRGVGRGRRPARQRAAGNVACHGHASRPGRHPADLPLPDRRQSHLAVPLPTTCTDAAHPAKQGTPATPQPVHSAFANRPWRIDDDIPATATTCSRSAEESDVRDGTGAPGGCTGDLVHRFY